MLKHRFLSTAAAVVFGVATLAGAARAAGPQVVEGPGALPECFKPFKADTTYFQWKKKDGPYKIALANGFVGNTWRIQMIKTAKAFVEAPDIAPDVKELKVVSTGTDVAAQIAAIDNFINAGLRRDRHHRREPDGLRAGDQARQQDRRRAGAVRQRDRQQGSHAGQRRPAGDGPSDGPLARQEHPRHTGKILEVRGLPGNSVDRDRHLGFREIMEAAPATSSRSSKSSATGTTARRRRSSPTRSPCTSTSTACSCRAAPPARCAH